jgi:membrane dipeptidase
MFSRIISTLLATSVLFLSSCVVDYAGEQGIEEAMKLHHELLTVDSHTDTPLRFFKMGTNLARRSDSRKGGGKLDFPRMKEGGLDAVFFAVFLGQRERTSEGNETAKNRALTLFDSIHAVVGRNSEMAEIALSSSDLKTIAKKGKSAVYIGIENAYPIGRDLSLVERYYNMGARYITLCHTANNDVCDSSTDKDGEEHGGLSKFGAEVIMEMNRLGIMIDVSHVSDKSFFDVIEISQAPVIASHSNSREVCKNPRNLTDDMLLKLADNDGVIQLCVLSDYVAETEPFPERDSAKLAVREKYGDWNGLGDSTRNLFAAEWYAIDDIFPPRLANVSQFCDHVDHIVDLTGIDHVGFGSDFDGGAGLDGCYDVTELPNVTLELLRRGYSKSDLQKFWSGNLMRVMRDVETAARL